MGEALVTYGASGLFFAAVNPLSWAHLVAAAIQGFRDRFDRFVTVTLWLVAANAVTVLVLMMMPLDGFKRLSAPAVTLFIAATTVLVNGAAGALVFWMSRNLHALLTRRDGSSR